MLSTELRDTIQDFIEAKITLAQLEDWLVPRLPYYLRFPNSTDADVVSAVELGLAEISSRIRSKDEIREYLKQVLQENTAISAFYPQDTSVHVETVSVNGTSQSAYNISLSPVWRPL